MAVRVITGRLEALSHWELRKDGVYKWPWWRIVDSEGRDHLLKDVRALAYMHSHALTDTEGSFAFTVGGTPIFLGLKYDGQVRDDHEAWKKELTGWPTFFLAFLAMDLVLLTLIYFKLIDNVIVGVIVSFILIISPFILLFAFARCINAWVERLPKKDELREALEKAA